ncbi:flagellar basal-body rod protein FlgB [Lachnospiraceae bacterium XBB1006]|nr:flagellar basal-body rod protein FlgB [Lachnospiraceae bacterium XBB1006]
MINSGIYDYINVLDKAADASYLRNQAIAHNIANDDTPGYKRVDVDFQTVLAHEIGRSKYISLDEKMKGVNLSHLNVKVEKDMGAFPFSYRIDGNNVDIDNENVELASNQIVYQGLTDSMGQEFNRIKQAMS